MEETKNNKIFIIIGVAILVIIIAILVGATLLVKKEKPAPTEIKEPEKPERRTPENLEKDINFSFLKMEYNDNNVIYSPLSIKLGLGLLKEGADGNTLEQLNKVIDNNIYKVENVDKKIGISNAIFMVEDYKNQVKEEYMNNLKTKYNSDVFYDNFNTPDKVNNYVKEKTFDMIPKLFDSLGGSKIVLVNALAIDLNWKYSFDMDNTHNKTFYSKEEIQTKFITDTFKKLEGIKYYKDDSLNMVSLPLEKTNDTELEYIIIMPKNLNSYIDNLTLETYEKELDLLKDGSTKNISISLPKYKYAYEPKFKTDLQDLGLTDMFDSQKANFYKIANTGLFIDQAVHKAIIEVSEKGIKAAAATGFAMKENAMFEQDKIDVVLEFNKPFISIIRDKNTKDIWFVGTVYNPSLGEKNES